MSSADAIRIRDAVIADASAVAAIYNQSILNSTATFDTVPKTPDDRAEWLSGRSPKHPVIVAEDSGVIVGWGSLGAWGDRCAYEQSVEISVYVDDAHVGRGIGRALSEELIGRAPTLGLHAVLSRVCHENEASLRMTESLGFERVGHLREVGRKFGRWLDVIIYERIVDAG